MKKLLPAILFTGLCAFNVCARNDVTLGLGPSFFNNDFLGDSSGISLLLDARANIPETPIDFEFRFQAANHSLDDLMIRTPYSRYPTYLYDGDLTFGDIKLQLIINTFPDSMVNLYLAGGCLIRTITLDYEIGGYGYSSYYDYWLTDDETEATYSIAAGLDLDLPGCYLRGEVSFVGETFDEYGGEEDVIIYGDVGIKITDIARVGVAGSYCVNTEVGLAAINFGCSF